MAVKIRLARFGSKKKPFYRIIVSDARAPRDGRFIERVGTYDPQKDPPSIHVNKERIVDWLLKGAQPTPTVVRLLKRVGINTVAKKVV
ncbi:MAG: 30S ribosomal protein S16 [Deltaproteobacteria bacterium]|nr:MAG: 30S ribosomal protein S16 [Deltaproteobacteria bacterium]